jgi:hypothetical protein
MNQYLIAFCYLFTIILLFLAFFIVCCLPPGHPLNIDLYRSNTTISLAIYNPVEFNIPEGKKPENNWGTNWNNQDDQDSYNRFNDENTWNAPQYTADPPGTDTPEWIDWVFAHINLDQISVTVHILSHHIYLFSFLRRTHLLWGLYSYDWYHCMYLVGSTSFSLFLL